MAAADATCAASMSERVASAVAQQSLPEEAQRDNMALALALCKWMDKLP